MLQVLEDAHRTIVRLNTECVASLTQELPYVAEGLSPYRGKREYTFETADSNMELFPGDETSALVRSFQAHPAIVIASETAGVLKGPLTQANYTELILGLVRSIVNAGPLNSPEQLQEIVRSQNKASPNRILVRHLCALVCLHASLDVLNQLLFQAIMKDKPPVLTEDVLIDNKFPGSSHLVGEGRTFMYQLTDRNVHTMPGDIVLIRAPSVDLNLTGQVTGSRITTEYGMTMEIDIWVIDDNLNPFSSLLEII